jgi:hypothetical protein
MLCFSMPLAIAAGPSPFRDGRAADPPARERLLGCRDEFGSRSHSLNVAEIAGRRRPLWFARERERSSSTRLNAVAIFRSRTARTAPPTSASATCLRQTNAARRLRNLVLRMRPHGFVALGACGVAGDGAGGHYWPRARRSRR